MCNRLAHVVVALGVASTAGAQNLAWRVEGSRVVENLGFSVAFLGDVDGDGVADILAGAPAFPVSVGGLWHVDPDPLWPLSTSPRVHVLSGADGHQILRVDGPAGSAFGVSVANAGDFDGDGFDDLLVGAPLDGDGAVFVHSSADGSKLLEVRGSSAGSAFGAAVAALGDVSGDGVPDFAAGAPFHLSGSAKVGRVAIGSGADGTVLFERLGGKDGCRYGMHLSNSGDVDADGLDDLAATDQDVDASRNGRLEVVSGGTFALLHSIKLSSSGFVDRYDWRVASAGDVDADGHADVIVGRPELGIYGSGAARVYSGRDGSLLHSPSPLKPFATCVGTIGDLDRDGHDDFGVSGPVRTGEHVIVFYSGRTGAGLGTTPGGHYQGPILSFASGSDLDGDGLGDLALGARADVQADSSGATTAVSLAGPSILWHAVGEASFGLGGALALHDDLDGDGFRELLVARTGTCGSSPAAPERRCASYARGR